MPTAIITGASRGLGLELTRALSQTGWKVIVDARNSDELRSAVWGLDNVTALPGDVTDPAHRAELVHAAQGSLDLLVNNAGALGPSPLPPVSALDPDDLAGVLATNVLAPLALTQLALPLLRGDGVVVNISSDAAVEAYPGWGGYGASKAALEQLGRVLAEEEAELRVWQVDPGDLRTRMHQDAYPGEDISDRPLPETVAPAFVELLRERPKSGRYRLQP